MGCYEMIHGKCPSCGKDFTVQSKLGDCAMVNLNIDSEFPGLPEELYSKNILLKERCFECGGKIVMILMNDQIIGFGKHHEEVEELAFGDYKILDGKE